MIGQIISDRYEIQKQLGKKAGRQTFLARDLQTQELVVIKLLTFGEDFEWKHLELFEREAQTLRNLSHPAIPRYLNHFDVNLPNFKGFALVQTYIDAKSLEEQLNSGRTFNQEEVKELAKSLLEILIYLHGQNPPVIHRDIKPSNILLTNRSGHSVGQVYLVDFGAVQTLAAREGATMTLVGTYGYMPPEQFGGRVVPASDLYSLGATLIYLFTGTPPADLPQKDLRIEFEKFTNLSPALRNWLRRMTEPSLERRFQSAEQALQALEALESSQLVPLTPSEISQPFGSKILLYKDSEKFELIVPAEGFHPGLVFLGAFAIAWNSFIFFWTSMALTAPSPGNLFFALFSLPFWAAGISMILKILFSLFGRNILHIDREKISLAKELFGFRYRQSRSFPRQAINKLQRTNLSYTKDSDGDRVSIPPSLIIWAGTQKYRLDFPLSEPELDWIAYELSDWLGLPISN
ncbi:MAG: serine/threonine protein kinase [Hydrococcus sp. C42_A2020_068]|nr:serine/threonine protein kinase [Hydrococcus sp. C42_A2020_068]